MLDLICAPLFVVRLMLDGCVFPDSKGFKGSKGWRPNHAVCRQMVLLLAD